jgi:osomolarity two-component system phosphorelay intermediate protein YPD1
MSIQISKQNPTINYSEVLDRIGGDRDFLSELLILYLNDFRIKYLKLKNALQKKDFILMYELGHGLKGSSANLSLPLLEKLSHQIEQAGKEKNIEKTRTTLDALYSEYTRLLDFVFPPKRNRTNKISLK